MKEGWEYIAFKDVYPIKMGKTPPRGDKSSWDEKKETHNKWVSIADISNNEGKTIEDTKEYISDSAAEKINKVSKGSLLMSFKLSIGRMAFAGDDLYTNEAIIAIPKNDKYILRFIYFYLLSYDWLSLTEGNEKVKGATLNKSSIGKIQLPILSLSEQQSIVDYLDSAFAKIDAMKANTEKALNEAKALFQASLKEMLEPKEGWVTSTLKDECYKITDGTHQTPKYYPSGYIFLSSRNVTSRKIDWEDVKFIDESQHQLMYKRVAPQVGDILLAKNGTTGVAAMVDRDVVFDIYVSLALLRSRGNVTPEYLLAFVNSPIAKEQFDKRLIGMGVPNLHLGEINQVVITYPQDKVEQIRMTQRIEELDCLIIRLQENYDKISQECDALKQAILRQVFE